MEHEFRYDKIAVGDIVNHTVRDLNLGRVVAIRSGWYGILVEWPGGAPNPGCRGLAIRIWYNAGYLEIVDPVTLLGGLDAGE
jgi:hypothetical protein